MLGVMKKNGMSLLRILVPADTSLWTLNYRCGRSANCTRKRSGWNEFLPRPTKNSPAISTITTLERYHLGMVTDQAELGPLEEHLWRCAVCVDRAEATALYVDAMRAYYTGCRI